MTALVSGACPVDAESACVASTSTIQNILEIKFPLSKQNNGASCYYKYAGETYLSIDPNSHSGSAGNDEKWKKNMAVFSVQCTMKPEYGPQGAWCVGPLGYHLFFDHSGTVSDLNFNHWPISAVVTEPKAAKLARSLFSGAAMQRAATGGGGDGSKGSKAANGEKDGIIFQAGLWKVTTTGKPHLASQDNSGFSNFLSKTTVATYCSTGRNDEAFTALKVGQSGCSGTHEATAVNAETVDFECQSMLLGSKVQVLLHSELKMTDAKHASAVMTSTTKGIGADSITDGLQEWLFVGANCGSVQPGQMVDQ